GTQFKFLNWFQEWWNWYGPSSFEILPEKIQNLWPKFFDKFHPELDQKHIYRTIHFSRNYAFLGLFHGIILMSKTNTPEFHY
ncbi:hypothetical protein Gotur_001865, partial [Gossypium turneri]